MGIAQVGERENNGRFVRWLFFAFCLAAPSASALAQITTVNAANPFLEDFERKAERAIRPPWFTEGAVRNGETIGIDINLGQASNGIKNAFIRMPTGKNALTRSFKVITQGKYVVSANIRTSANVDTAFMGLRDAKGRILNQVKVGPNKKYKTETVEVQTGSANQVTFFVGFLGKGTDGWIQVDNISIKTNTHVLANPIQDPQ